MREQMTFLLMRPECPEARRALGITRETSVIVTVAVPVKMIKRR